jgi:purine-cytosine permease-like protein
MVRYNFLLYFFDVKMAMATTFGYRQVMWLETCLNPSILWLLIIFCCKKLTMYVFNFTKKILSKKSFLDVVAPLNCQKLATRETLIK